MDFVFTNPVVVDILACYVRDFRIGALLVTLQRQWAQDVQVQQYLARVRGDAEAIVDHEIRVNERAFQLFLEQQERNRAIRAAWAADFDSDASDNPSEPGMSWRDFFGTSHVVEADDYSFLERHLRFLDNGADNVTLESLRSGQVYDDANITALTELDSDIEPTSSDDFCMADLAGDAAEDAAVSDGWGADGPANRLG